MMIDRARLLHPLPPLSGKKSVKRDRSSSRGQGSLTRRRFKEDPNPQIVIIPNAAVVPIPDQEEAILILHHWSPGRLVQLEEF